MFFRENKTEKIKKFLTKEDRKRMLSEFFVKRKEKEKLEEVRQAIEDDQTRTAIRILTEWGATNIDEFDKNWLKFKCHHKWFIIEIRCDSNDKNYITGYENLCEIDPKTLGNYRYCFFSYPSNLVTDNIDKMIIEKVLS